MQDGAPVSSAGRKLERVSNGAPRGMIATRVASSDGTRAQNPAYRPALWSITKKPASVMTPAFCWAQRFYASTISNECVISAVFASMIDAEQYLSCDRLIARSTVAGFRFLPVTVK
jgi:hypothetical protein